MSDCRRTSPGRIRILAGSEFPLPRRLALFAVLLALLAVVPFLPGLGAEFVELDDPVYVTGNPPVQAGLTIRGVLWSFTTFHAGNWHPLTWISHMTDVSLFGSDPRGHHLVGILLHGANGALLFLVLARMTASVGASALVAALFAVHPQRVESVIWISERKDLLAGFFFLLTVLAYDRYALSTSRRRFAPVLLFLALGLMSKSMLVTVPFILLLLDCWPLGRTAIAPPEDGRPWQTAPLSALVREKLPLFALAAASSVVTFASQRAGGAVAGIEVLPLSVRLANASVSTVGYLAKAAWPTSLAVLYPHPMQTGQEGLSLRVIAASALLLILVSWALLAWLRRAPFLAVGWFWYAGMLVPVIGIVQVGNLAMADRYTYLPMIGILVAVAWGGRRLLRGRRSWLAGTLAVAVIAALGAATWVQTGYWKDSKTLFGRTLSLTTDNWLIENSLGAALYRQGRLDESAARFREAIRILPEYGKAHGNLGRVLAEQGEIGQALVHLREAVRLQPESASARTALGHALLLAGAAEEALPQFEEAVRLEPDAATHRLLGSMLLRRGRREEAIVHFREAVRLAPDSTQAAAGLAAALSSADAPAAGRR